MSALSDPDWGGRPSLRFVASCCRWPDDADRRALVEKRAANVTDWPSIVDLAVAHRVEPLVADAIRRFATGAPAETVEWATAMRDAARVQATLEIAETLKICDALSGMNFKVIKGVPLGIDAYGRAAMKRSWDVDILVDKSDAVEAARRIVALGYYPSKPPRLLDEGELRRWSSVSKHANFGSSSGIEAELHWTLTSLPGMLAGIKAAGPARMVEILGGRTVPTLTDAENLPYLCVHGTSHGWSRLKWLADFSALANRWGEEELERLVSSARSLGAEEAIAASFLIRQRLFGFSVPGCIAPTDRSATIADLALSVIAARRSDIAIEDDPAPAATIERIRRLMGRGRYYVPAYLLRRHRGTEIRALIALPKGLEWAYWLIRPYSYLRRLAIRHLGA